MLESVTSVCKSLSRHDFRPSGVPVFVIDTSGLGPGAELQVGPLMTRFSYRIIKWLCDVNGPGKLITSLIVSTFFQVHTVIGIGTQQLQVSEIGRAWSGR